MWRAHRLNLVTASTLTFAFVVAGPATAQSVKLADSPIQPGPNFSKERLVVRAATYHNALDRLVGHVLYPRKVAGKCGDSVQNSYDAAQLSLASYLKPATKLEPSGKETVIFSGKVSGGKSGGLKFLIFDGDFKDSAMAELTVVERVSLTIPKDGAAENWADAALSVMLKDECPPVLIVGARLLAAQYKWANQRKGGASIVGSVFGVNGKAFVVEEQANLAHVIGVDIVQARGAVIVNDKGQVLGVLRDSSVFAMPAKGGTYMRVPELPTIMGVAPPDGAFPTR